MTARRPSVLTALPDVWDGAVVGRLGSRVTVGRRCVDLPDLLAAAHARLGDVALVSPRLRGLDLSAVRDLRLGSVGVLGVVDPDDEAGEAMLRQLGVRTFVAPDAPAADLYGAVVGALAVPSVPSDGDGDDLTEEDEITRRGQVVAVWGPAGAPGRTTVAVNLAAELALGGREVVLVDVDTQAASVAQHLAILDEAPGVAAACRAAEHGTLDVTSFGRLAPEVLPRLRVLTGLPSPDRWPELRSGAIERMLEVARLDCDVVVVDCASCLEDDDELSYDTVAPRRNMAALTALDVADQVVVVGAGDPVGLQRLVRGLQDLAGRDVEIGGVVVNRLRASAVGARPMSRVQSLLERFGGVEAPVLVPLDVERVDAALLAGTVLHDVAADAPVRHAIASVATALVG